MLPAEAVEIAAERVVKHRTACRLRYRATVEVLRKALPHLLRRKRDDLQSTLDGNARDATTAE